MSSRHRSPAWAGLLAAALASAGCATTEGNRDLFHATGACLVATGVVGGVTVGTSVIYDPAARDEDGAFVPVADQEGTPLWPWGVGIATVGVLGGSALFVAAALLDEDEPARATGAPPPPPDDGGATDEPTLLSASVPSPASTTSE